MNKVTINNLNTKNNSIIVDKYKLIFGFDLNLKNTIRNQIRKYFEKESRLEYDIENNIDNRIMINDRQIDLKKYDYIELFLQYDIKEDMKIGSKSIFQKYYDLLLEKIEYNEIFISTNNLLKTICDDINLSIDTENITINGTITDLTKKLIIKMIELNLLKNEFEISQYSLTYEEVIKLQLKIVKEMAKIDELKDYIIFIDIPYITDSILKELNHNYYNLILLVNTYAINEKLSITDDSIAIAHNNIYDLNNEEQMYEIAMDCKRNLSINELKKELTDKMIIRTKEVVSNIINEIID